MLNTSKCCALQQSTLNICPNCLLWAASISLPHVPWTLKKSTKISDPTRSCHWLSDLSDAALLPHLRQYPWVRGGCFSCLPPYTCICKTTFFAKIAKYFLCNCSNNVGFVTNYFLILEISQLYFGWDNFTLFPTHENAKLGPFSFTYCVRLIWWPNSTKPPPIGLRDCVKGLFLCVNAWN